VGFLEKDDHPPPNMSGVKMKKIKDYMLVAKTTQWEFEADVSENIELGWQPFGSFFHHKWPDDEKGYKEEYIQAMVLYEGDQ
jgi:hypothetical protein